MAASRSASSPRHCAFVPPGSFPSGFLRSPHAPLGYNPLHSDLGPDGEAFDLGFGWLRKAQDDDSSASRSCSMVLRG